MGYCTRSQLIAFVGNLRSASSSEVSNANLDTLINNVAGDIDEVLDTHRYSTVSLDAHQARVLAKINFQLAAHQLIDRRGVEVNREYLTISKITERFAQRDFTLLKEGELLRPWRPTAAYPAPLADQWTVAITDYGRPADVAARIPGFVLSNDDRPTTAQITDALDMAAALVLTLASLHGYPVRDLTAKQARKYGEMITIEVAALVYQSLALTEPGGSLDLAGFKEIERNLNMLEALQAGDYFLTLKA